MEGEDLVRLCPECGEPMSEKDKYDLCKNCRKAQRKMKRKEWWSEHGPIVAAIGVALGVAAIRAVLSETGTLFDDYSEDDDDSEDSEEDGYIDCEEGDGKTIYTTEEWNGYGKQNYYRNKYKIKDGKVAKFKCHRYKFFDGDESNWEEDEDLVESWDVDDPDLPDWLKKLI